MISTEDAPVRIGLCPNPQHYGEFYVPMTKKDGPFCPDSNCDARLIVYTREAPHIIMPEGGWRLGERVLVDERWAGQIVPLPEREGFWPVQFFPPRGGTEYIAELRITGDRRERQRRDG